MSFKIGAPFTKREKKQIHKSHEQFFCLIQPQHLFRFIKWVNVCNVRLCKGKLIVLCHLQIYSDTWLNFFKHKVTLFGVGYCSTFDWFQLWAGELTWLDSFTSHALLRYLMLHNGYYNVFITAIRDKIFWCT